MHGFGHGRPLSAEEKAEAPKISKELVFRALRYLKPYKPQLTAILGMILVTSVLGVLPPKLTGWIIDKGFLGGDFTLIVWLIAASFGTMIVSGLIGVLQSYVNT
jgi:ATP-binding cassette subfamily B protein